MNSAELALKVAEAAKLDAQIIRKGDTPHCVVKGSFIECAFGGPAYVDEEAGIIRGYFFDPLNNPSQAWPYVKDIESWKANGQWCSTVVHSLNWPEKLRYLNDSFCSQTRADNQMESKLLAFIAAVEAGWKWKEGKS